MKISAHGKINLSLYITGCREDGYHTLHTVMQSVSLADVLTITKIDSDDFLVTCSQEELKGEENLAYKAAKLFTETLQVQDKFHIHIEKQIPVSGGMGGGSADAAGVLFGLNHWYETPFSMEALCAMALSLGADVPFCLIGGTQLATGIGEVLSPLAPLPDCGILLVKPCEKGSTGAMYRKYDEIKGLSQRKNCDIIDWIEKNDLVNISHSLENDFQPLYKNQAVEQAVSRLLDAGAMGACLTGSGPTVFGIFKTVDLARQAAERLRLFYEHCIVTTPVSEGCQVITE